MIIFLMIMGSAHAAFPVTRQNVGVLFDPLPGPIINGHDTTDIILAIPYSIPSPPPPSPNFTAEYQKLQSPSLQSGPNTDKSMLSQIRVLQTISVEADFQIIQAVNTVKLFLSEPIEHGHHRTKRGAPFAFLGEVFKGIMGLVTQQDLELIVKSIINIDAVLQAIRSTGVSMAELLGLLTTKVDNNYKLILEKENNMEMTLNKITSNMDTFTTNFTNTLAFTQTRSNIQDLKLTLLADATTTLQYKLHYLHTINNIITSLRQLSRGILTPDVLPPMELKGHLEQLDKKLRIEAPGSRVVIKDTEYYYTQRLSHFLYSQNHLYIHINIIVAATESLFDLYQAKIIPVPINTNTTTTLGTTKLMTDVDFLAVSRDRSLFLELKASDLHLCPGDIVRICSSVSPRIHNTYATCMVAVFQNDAETVKTMCEFKIRPLDATQTNALTIGKDTYLISTQIDQFTLNCHGKPSNTQNAKSLFIITIPCACTLNIGHLALPNTKVPCGKANFTFIKYTVNLPILHAFKLETTLITPNMTLNTPYIYTPPRMHDFLKILHTKSNIDSTTQIDLHPFAIAVLNKAKSVPLPPSLAEELSIMEQIANSPIWEYVLAAISVLALLLSIYCTFRIHCAAPAFHLLPQVNAYKFIMDHTPKPEPTIPKTGQSLLPPDFAQNIIDHKDTHSIFMILLFGLGFYIAFKILKRIYNFLRKCIGKKTKCKRSNPDITLKIYKAKSNYSIPLAPVPFERDIITDGCAPKIESIEAVNFPRPHIRFVWNDSAQVVVGNSIKDIELPTIIPLPYKAWFGVLPAIRNPKTSYALVFSPDTHYPTKSLKVMDPKDHVDGELHERLADHFKSPPTTIQEFARQLFKTTVEVTNET